MPVQRQQQETIAPDLVEVAVSEAWVTLVLACQDKGNIKLETRIINGQPTDFTFSDQHYRADLSRPTFPIIEVAKPKTKKKNTS